MEPRYSFAAWKFEAPTPPERELLRAALVRRMEEHLANPFGRGAVFLLAAPAGYGKSTLASQWARQTSLPVAWYALEPSDADPVVFVRGLMRALQPIAPGANWRVARVLEHLPNGALSHSDLKRVTTRLVDDLRRIFDQPVALALSNVRTQGPGRGANAVLSGLLGQLPDALRLVIETHARPRLAFSPLYADQQLAKLGRDELAFSDEEVTRLLALHAVELSDEQLARLRRLFDGWIAGILLATDAGAPAFLAQAHPDKLNRQAVFDYLTSHVLDALPANLLDFAMRVAVVDPITPELANDLLGIDDARERLDALERHTAFITRTGGGAGESVYRLQRLMRQALLARFKREHGEEQRRAAHERAAELLEGEHASRAAHHWAHAQRFDRVAELIEARRGTMLRSGRGATLEKWIATIPPEQRQRQPRLQLLLAELYRLQGHTQLAWQALRHVCAAVLPEAEQQRELAARALTLRAGMRFERGRIAAARRDAERAVELIASGGASEPADQLDRSGEARIQAAYIIAACCSTLGDPAGADAYLHAAEDLAQRSRDLWALAQLSYLRSNFAMRAGRYGEAERHAVQALCFGQEANDDVGAVSSRLNLAALRASRGAHAQAREDVQTAMDQARHAGFALGRVYAYLNLGDLERLEGNYSAALAAYHRAIDAAERVGDAHGRVAAQCWIGLTLALMGRTREAIALLEPLANDSEPAHIEFASNALLSLGIAHYRAGDYEQALQTLRTARERAIAERFVTMAIRADVFLAATHLAQERLAEARAALRAALGQVDATEDVGPVLLPNVALVPELRPLLEWMDDPRARALARAFRERSSAVGVARATASATAEGASIRVFTFGGARVYVGENLVEHWRLPAAREMLCYLLDHREPMRKETLLADLWSDKSDDLANLNFRQAVFQLKRALRQPGVKKAQGRWTLAVDCWVDTAEFERLANEGEQLALAGDLSQAAVMLRQALTYYHGSYLEDVYNEWGVIRREELYVRRVAVLERLADVEERLGHFDEAAQYSFELLEDPSAHESAYRGLMRHFARRREFDRVRAQYERCVAALAPDMAPSAETQALYQQLLAEARTRTSRSA